MCEVCVKMAKEWNVCSGDKISCSLQMATILYYVTKAMEAHNIKRSFVLHYMTA